MGADGTDAHVRDTASGDAEPAEPAAPATAPRRRRVLRRVLISLGVLSLVLAVLIGGGVWFLTERYAGNVQRLGNVFAGIDPHNRPAPETAAPGESDPPVNFLLIGSDTRAHPAPGDEPGSRSDALMIAHVSGDRQHVQVVSIPRDSWVPIPGHGVSKINAAYAWGGPKLAVQTVEQLTGIRIDHVIAIDFDGIIDVTDKLGGVDVNVAETTSNGGYTFPAGMNHLNGVQARWYLGQRYGLPGGDFDRERRQQQYLKAVFAKEFSSGTFTNPVKLDSSLRALTSAVAVDSELTNTEMLSLAISLRNLTPQNVQFFTSPVLGTGMEGAASVVYLDRNACDRMWRYLKSDSLGQNAGEFSQQQLPDVPR